MAKGSSSLNRPRKREGLRPRLFQIDRVSNWSLFTEKRWQLPPWFLLFTSIFPKSACLSQALRRLWCFCRFSKLIPTRKLGVAQKRRTCPPMTDFYRKVNKFSQKFIKCDPCLPPSSFFNFLLTYCYSRITWFPFINFSSHSFLKRRRSSVSKYKNKGNT